MCAVLCALYCALYCVCGIVCAVLCVPILCDVLCDVLCYACCVLYIVCAYLDAHLKGGRRLFLSFSNTMTSPSFSVATTVWATRADPLLGERYGTGGIGEDEREQRERGWEGVEKGEGVDGRKGIGVCGGDGMKEMGTEGR
jgi:hypothetical protein